MEINIIGTVIIGIIVLAVSVLIIKSMGYEISFNLSTGIKELINSLFSIFSGKSNICGSYENEYISVKDFETILDAYYHGLCEDKTSVILSFSLSKEDIKKISESMGIAKNGNLILFNHKEPVGVGAIVVDGNYSKYIFKTNDKIEIWNEGEPEKDVLLNLTETDCNIKEGFCLPREVEYDEWECPITKDRKEGEVCDCNSQCIGDLLCEESGRCCQSGKTWDGSKCEFEKTFVILFMQLKQEGKEFIPIENFEEKSEVGKDTWVELTSLRECSERVRIIVENRYCQVPNQDLLCQEGTMQETFTETIQSMYRCMRNWGYDNIYTRVEGVIPGDHVCCMENGCVNGYTGGYNYPLVSSESNIQFVSSHEMGHTFGLCDEAYGGGTCAGNLLRTCESKYCSPVGGGMGCGPGPNCCPNKPEMDSIMCTDPKICNRENECSYAEKFASTSYSHLEKELGEFCE